MLRYPLIPNSFSLENVDGIVFSIGCVVSVCGWLAYFYEAIGVRNYWEKVYRSGPVGHKSSFGVLHEHFVSKVSVAGGTLFVSPALQSEERLFRFRPDFLGSVTFGYFEMKGIVKVRDHIAVVEGRFPWSLFTVFVGLLMILVPEYYGQSAPYSSHREHSWLFVLFFVAFFIGSITIGMRHFKAAVHALQAFLNDGQQHTSIYGEISYEEFKEQKIREVCAVSNYGTP